MTISCQIRNFIPLCVVIKSWSCPTLPQRGIQISSNLQVGGQTKFHGLISKTIAYW